MKRLGQHFLKNKSALKKIADALELKSGDFVIEIGAGHGELTNELLSLSFEVLDKKANPKIKIIAVEKDKELVKILREKFAGDKNVEIIEGDAIQIIKKLSTNIIPQLWYNISNKESVAGGLAKFKIVGNIPYYITGRLFRIIGELTAKPELCVFTIQKEVAERIAAQPPKMNRLAASVQFWAEPEIIGILPKKDFEPQPEVDSAVIKLKTKNEKSKNNEMDYYRTVRILFAQPRKTILNNLASSKTENRALLAEKLKKIGINPQGRPQNLRIGDIIKTSGLF